MFQKIKDWYKKYFFKSRLTSYIYYVLNGIVSAEARMRKFYFPAVYLRHWKLDMMRGKYEKSTRDLFYKIIKPGMVVIDVGAHIGYYTRIFAKLVGASGAVYAFEPDDLNNSLLLKNTAPYPAVKVFKVAVSDHNGQVNFFVSDLKTGCHSTVASPLRPFKSTIEAITLDDFVNDKKIAEVDILKMDIEGGEVAALKGMENLLKNNPNIKIVTEFNPDCFKDANINPLSFIQQILNLGFKIFAIRDNGELDPVTAHSTAEQITNNRSFVNIYCLRNP